MDEREIPTRWRDLLDFARICCANAVRLEATDPRDVLCVCAHREWCDTHGLTHVGTHD
jgi:hypothetical protein